MNEAIIIAFLGDIYLGDDSSHLLSFKVKELLGRADLVVANLEGPITDHPFAAKEKILLKSATIGANTLKDWGIDVVSLANNHIFDAGWIGFDQTRKELDKVGVAYVGAGGKIEEASRPLILDVKNMKIGFLAYSWEKAETRCATKTSYGCASLDEQLTIHQIRRLVRKVDLVIVLTHWGYCEYTLPLPQHVSLAKKIIQAGAQVVVGHHSHVVQGVSINNNSVIAYSLGNFAFSEYYHRGTKVRLTKENRQGIILQLRAYREKPLHCEEYHTLDKKNVILLTDSVKRKKHFSKRCTILTSRYYERRWRWAVGLRLLRRTLNWLRPSQLANIRKEQFIRAWLTLKEFYSNSN